ncbi:c-type cytochrome [Pseudomonas sp. NA-150]|uniref:SorB family sulfite dehydrogenase c-type cytochrome subunit n=1 Tax=Pseudomonas sp. NA-150 TaxID=3367525 RepID=UPI0037CA55DF
MNYMNTLLIALLACLAVQAQATPLEIKLPPETAVLKPSALPGYPLAQQKCSICHSADYINFQPPAMSLAQWTGEAAKMQHVYGAPVTDQDVQIIGAYLAVTYGSAKATDANVLAASAAVAPPSADKAPANDAMALLKSNGCLACHSLDKKVVGPAYHDVAAKYAHDSQALATVEASIRNGGSGKWGEVPMPPFSQLSEADIKMLATFILSQ